MSRNLSPQDVERDSNFLISFPFLHAHKVYLTCIHIHQLLLRPGRTRLCEHGRQAHMFTRFTSLPAQAAYRLLPASVFIISKRTPRSLTCTLLILSSLVPRIPLRPPQGLLALTQYSSVASCCYRFLLRVVSDLSQSVQTFTAPSSSCYSVLSLFTYLSLL